MSEDGPIPVYFRCDGGREDGLGHLSRCLVLAERLGEDTGSAPIFITYAPDGVGERFIEGRGFHSLPSPAPAGAAQDLASLRETLRQAGGRRPLLVIDSRRVDGAYVEACRREAFVACLDDEELRDLPCDLLINSHVWVTAESYAPRAGRRVLAGADHNLIAPDLFAGPKRPLADGGPLQVLVTLGGEDPHNHTAWVLANLGDLLLAHRVTVILGPAHPDPVAARRLAHDCLPSAEVVDSPSGLAHYISAADLAITAGGITCTELAAARVPQLAIVVEDHQWPQVEALEARGCLVALGSHAGLPRDEARRTLARFLGSSQARGEMAEAAAALFPESGVPRVCAAILRAYRESN